MTAGNALVFYDSVVELAVKTIPGCTKYSLVCRTTAGSVHVLVTASKSVCEEHRRDILRHMDWRKNLRITPGGSWETIARLTITPVGEGRGVGVMNDVNE